MNKKEVNVTVRWVLTSLKPWMIFCLFIFGVTSSFEGVLNGYILGYIPRLNVKDWQQPDRIWNRCGFILSNRLYFSFLI